jgi:hypothetical protein
MQKYKNQNVKQAPGALDCGLQVFVSLAIAGSEPYAAQCETAINPDVLPGDKGGVIRQ